MDFKKKFCWMGPSFFDDQILCLGKKKESVSVIIGTVDFKKLFSVLEFIKKVS